ncbi:hypothetical protein AADZ84_07075 [Colwelliaceae bacterium MEBiC 14330]
MWSRTFAGLIFGLLISISVILNLNLTLPIQEDSMLLIGLLLAFPIWVGIQVWAYSFTESKKAWLTLFWVFLPSALLNSLLLALR